MSKNFHGVGKVLACSLTVQYARSADTQSQASKAVQEDIEPVSLCIHNILRPEAQRVHAAWHLRRTNAIGHPYFNSVQITLRNHLARITRGVKVTWEQARGTPITLNDTDGNQQIRYVEWKRRTTSGSFDGLHHQQLVASVRAVDEPRQAFRNQLFSVASASSLHN